MNTKQIEEESTYEKVVNAVGGLIFKIGFFLVKIPVTILYYILKFIVFYVLIHFKVLCVKGVRKIFDIKKIHSTAEKIKSIKNISIFPVSWLTFMIGGTFNVTYSFLNQNTDKDFLKQDIDDYATFFSWALTVVFAILGFVSQSI